MNKRAIIVLLLLYLIAWVTGIFAVILPFWISTSVEDGVKEVQVHKQIDSGLFWKYERFEVRPESFQDSDDWWTGIAGTSMNTENLKAVKGLMMTGMTILSVSFIFTICVLCTCCLSEDKRKIPYIVIAVMLFVAAVCIAIGVVIFFKVVLDDYDIDENDEHLGGSFWLAVTSSIATLLTGLLISYYACSIAGENT